MTTVHPQSKPKSKPITVQAYLYAAVTVVMWASAFPGIRAGLVSYSPYSLALLRYLVASAVLLIYALVTQMPLPALRDVPGIAAVGFLGFSAYNVALNAGQQGVTAGVASFIVASAPIYMAIMATVLYRERLTGFGWLGILVSFGGVALISGASGTGWQVNGWALLVLIAAVVQAMYHVFQKSLLRNYTAIQFVTYAIWAGTAFLLIYTPGLLRDLQTAIPSATWAVVYMGVFPGAVGYVSWSLVMGRVPASVAGSFLYLVPFVAVLIAWVWLGEIPNPLSFVGGALIIAGVTVVNRLGHV
jgi:drug/metabolite transporter (DMT)-like permease